MGVLPGSEGLLLRVLCKKIHGVCLLRCDIPDLSIDTDEMGMPYVGMSLHV